MPLRLLFNSNPLRRASIWFWQGLWLTAIYSHKKTPLFAVLFFNIFHKKETRQKFACGEGVDFRQNLFFALPEAKN